MIKIIPKDSTENVSGHIPHREFRCKCKNYECKQTIYSTLLMEKFERLRELCGGRPIEVTSGYRCPQHNSLISGSSRVSRHMTGCAIDVKPPLGMSLDHFHDFAKEIGFGMIIPYHMQCFLHLDVRDLD